MMKILSLIFYTHCILQPALLSALKCPPSFNFVGTFKGISKCYAYVYLPPEKRLDRCTYPTQCQFLHPDAIPVVIKSDEENHALFKRYRNYAKAYIGIYSPCGKKEENTVSTKQNIEWVDGSAVSSDYFNWAATTGGFARYKAISLLSTMDADNNRKLSIKTKSILCQLLLDPIPIKNNFNEKSNEFDFYQNTFPLLYLIIILVILVLIACIIVLFCFIAYKLNCNKKSYSVSVVNPLADIVGVYEEVE